MMKLFWCSAAIASSDVITITLTRQEMVRAKDEMTPDDSLDDL